MTEDRPPQAPYAGAGGPGEPPPLTAFAWRNGLIRPTQGRLLAGVCGAFGRATNTDPVLWRIVIAVLTIFAGIGALVYLVAWLILPAEGDTASPIEALAGRGRSGTSTVLTVIGALIVVFSLAAYISEPFRATPLIAVALLAGALLLLLRDRGRIRPVPTNPVTGPEQAMSSPAPPPAYAAAPAYPPAAPAYGPPPYTPPPYAPPPFAPHGPFVPPPPPPPPPVPPMVRAPRPKPPRSRLGGLTFSVLLLSIGTLAVLNLAGFHIPPLAFFATALGVLGLGLILGTWVGRARWLIAPGIVLTLALAGGAAATVDGFWPNGWHNTGSVTWAPASAASLQKEYRLGVGDATLDLSSVDFSEAGPIEIETSVNLGSLKVIVPSNVDVIVDASVNLGDARVFRESWDGLGQSPRTITDLDNDGVGGGKLHLVASVHTGDLEVSR
jgi:phage shock protein PspC (stress-responsive transcriptional regulator)